MKISNFKFQISNNIKGFTLIELLLVITILGLLATFVMANFIGVRQRARDAQRKSDIAQYQSALEFFRSDQGRYPSNAEMGISTCGSGNSLIFGTVTYMQTKPCDPTNSAPYTYTYTGALTAYTLRACLENVNDLAARDPANANLTCTAGWSYTRRQP